MLHLQVAEGVTVGGSGSFGGWISLGLEEKAAMQDFIKGKIRAVFEDFRREAEKIGGLCACKRLTYERGNSPDYANPLVQQAYMLRFFPAYLVEYYRMYDNMIDHDFLRGQIKAISFGCGCGLDLWGLFFAVRDQKGDRTAQVDYTGIDLINWLYQDRLGLGGVRFLKQNITDWDKLDEDDYNVFVFPKCIGEFSNDVFESICAMFPCVLRWLNDREGQPLCQGPNVVGQTCAHRRSSRV